MSEQNVYGPAVMLLHNKLFCKFHVITNFHKCFSRGENPPPHKLNFCIQMHQEFK